MHRYRFEQRWIEDNFRVRFRYFLMLTIPLTAPDMRTGVWYASA